MVSRLGRLRQLSNGFGVFPLSRRGTAQVQETARASEYAATSPFSRVTAAAALPFLLLGLGTGNTVCLDQRWADYLSRKPRADRGTLSP